MRLLLNKNPAIRVRDVRTALEELRVIEASLRLSEMRLVRVEATEPLASSSMIDRLEASQLSLGVETEPEASRPSYPLRPLLSRGSRIVWLLARIRSLGVSTATASCDCWARAGWERSTRRSTRPSGARPCSSSCKGGRARWWRASFARPGRCPVCRTSGSSRSTTSSRRPGGSFIAMKLMEGGSLGTLLHREGPFLPLCRVLALAEDVAEALAHAHAQGVLHRDVKPSNILLDGEGQGYLADFGLAGILSKIELEDTHVTQALQVLGTPSYMAPEQFKPGPLTPAADVYSLGVTAYQG